jgi:hypothetical protein
MMRLLNLGKAQISFSLGSSTREMWQFKFSMGSNEAKKT